MSGHYRHEKNCLNCGHLVEGHYCSQCGQPNLELKEPFWGFMAHSIGHYFHFDAKFWQTLLPLLTKPGQVTLDYLAGKRARYIHPVSLYIFVSIVYFIVVPYVTENKEQEKKEYEQENVDKGDKLDSLKAALNDKDVAAYVPVALKKQMVKAIDSKLDFNKLSLPAQKVYLDSLKKLNQQKPSDSLKKTIEKYTEEISDNQDTTYSAYLEHQKALPSEDRDDWFTRQVTRSTYGFRQSDNRKRSNVNTKELAKQIKEEVKHYRPKQYFLLMPLLALMIMYIFRRNKRYYIDHLVFTIHGMTAYFLVSIVTLPIERYIFGQNSWMTKLLEFIVGSGILWYLYTGLKVFYERPRNATIRKTLMVTFLYALSVGITSWLLTAIVTYMMT